MRNLVLAGLLTCASFVAVASVVKPAGSSAPTATLGELIENDARLGLFASALRQSGMYSATGRNQWTMFVPTDEAMRNEGSDFLLGSVLLSPSNAGRLNDVVSHHIVHGRRIDLATLASATRVTSNAGQPIALERMGSGTRVDGHATVLDVIETSGGVIYLVDRLLWPEKWFDDAPAPSAS